MLKEEEDQHLLIKRFIQGSLSVSMPPLSGRKLIQEERNAELGIGCYYLNATYQGVKCTFDAGPRINR